MDYDAEHLQQCLFDEETAPALAALEDGPKHIAELAEECGLSRDDVQERFSYLVEHGFLLVKGDVYTADAEKMAGAMAGDSSGIVDGVTVLDSYLN